MIQRFAPERVERSWFGGALWRVGTLEAARTLDADATALVHVDAGADHATAASAFLVALDFTQQLERLRWTLADPGATTGNLTAIVDALVVELASELATANRPGHHRGGLAAASPRLRALADGVGTTRVGTPGGDAVCDLLARLAFFADTQVGWLDRLPPWRWWRRPVATARRVRDAVDATLAAAFPADEVAAARAATDARAERAHAALRARQPDNAHHHYNAGLFFKTRGRWAEGQAANQRAIDLGDTDQPAWWNLGICAPGAPATAASSAASTVAGARCGGAHSLPRTTWCACSGVWAWPSPPRPFAQASHSTTICSVCG